MSSRAGGLSKFQVASCFAIAFFGLAIGSIFNDFFDSATIDPAKNVVRVGGKTFVAVEGLTGEFRSAIREDVQFVVADGKTWIPAEGSPVELLVLSDRSCGEKCDWSGAVTALKNFITPALLVRVVDADSQEGKSLIEKFEISSVPKFFLAAGAEKFEKNGKKIVEELADFLTKKDELFLIDSGKAGFPTGKFLAPPNFENADDPKIGSGRVRVVEFTDFQCPYCRRFHEQSKKVIDELVSNKKIEYIVKDFPLGFHAEARVAHATANCVLKKSPEKYFEMKSAIFQSQKSWSGKGDVRDFFIELALDIGVELDRKCLADPKILAEIDADIAEGKEVGVSGTPAIFVGSQILRGAIPGEILREAVEVEIDAFEGPLKKE